MIDELEATLLSFLSGEHSSLSIDYNNHASSYMTLRETVDGGYFDHADWVSQSEKEKAISTNSVWEIRWYPNTPVGFYCIAASTLPAALARAVEMHKENGGQ